MLVLELALFVDRRVRARARDHEISSEKSERGDRAQRPPWHDFSDVRMRDHSGDEKVAIVRLEQFYPFPEKRLREIFNSYGSAVQLVWAQEEPKNMGGWTFVEPRLMNMLPACQQPYYVGRAASASPATVSYTIFELEQRRLVDQALTEDAEFISGASTRANAGPATS